MTPDDDGLPEDCAVNTDNLQTVRKAGLGTYITRLSHERMREVRAAIEFAFGFDALA